MEKKGNNIRRKIHISDIIKKKHREKITVLTAYDYASAMLCDRAGIDVLLVGDSAGMVVLGHKDTLSVTIEEMIIFCNAVSRGSQNCLIVGDMPFGSYHISKKQAKRNAIRFIKAGCDAVKIEGGIEMADTIKSIVSIGIPVMGHIGLKPQTSPLKEGYAIQGKTSDAALKIIEDAKALEGAGVFSIVIEMSTSEVAETVSNMTSVPIIGIGSGSMCDGQVLVYHDVLGLYDKIQPRFVKQYVNLTDIITNSLSKYKEDIRAGNFPNENNTYHIKEEELIKLKERIKEIGKD